MEQVIQELKESLSDIQKEVHTIKHEIANDKNQLQGLHLMLERLELVITKYEGNPEIGFDGKMKAFELELEKLQKQNKVLLEAYELGKTWKIKITGFFMVLSFLSAGVGALFGIVKALHWVWEHLSITTK